MTLVPPGLPFDQPHYNRGPGRIHAPAQVGPPSEEGKARDTVHATQPGCGMNARRRYEILRRDGFRCRYCGHTADDGVKLHVDHVVPTALGGTDDPGNLVAACADCNRGKASTSAEDPIIADVQEDALRWAEAIKAAAHEQTSQVELELFAIEEFDAAWSEWKVNGTELVWRARDWKESIRGFHRAGLEVRMMIELAEEAMGKDRISSYHTWRYFCGMCWRTLEDRQRRASEILNAQLREEQ